MSKSLFFLIPPGAAPTVTAVGLLVPGSQAGLAIHLFRETTPISLMILLMAKSQRVTLKTIADELGISVSVVSRILSGKSAKFQISSTTEAAVRRTAEKLHYTPNFLARSLRMQKTFALGLLIPDLSNLFFACVARYVECSARAENYSVLVADSQERADIEEESLQILTDRRVDGLIISPVGASYEHIAEIDQEECPIVLLDRYFPDLNVPYVTSDNAGGARNATQLLIDHGHTSIGFVQGLPQSSVNKGRVSGYCAALTDNGIEPREELIKGDRFTRSSGYSTVKTFLSMNPRPTALFLANNQIALGAIQAVSEAKLRVPEDISLIAFDEHEYSPYLAVPLTTVSQDEQKLAEHAFNLLKRRMDNPGDRDTVGITVPTHLVQRGSVRAL